MADEAQPVIGGQRAQEHHVRTPHMSLNVAVLANLKKNAPKHKGMPTDAWDDLDSDVTVNAIVSALESRGHSATFLEGNLTLIDSLPRLKPDICFNICEGHWGDSRESHVPALLEMLRIPYTASGVMTLALTLDKPMTKRVLAFHGLPTPAFQVFERADEPIDADLTFPLFVKPSREGTGMGVSGDSVVHTAAQLRERLAEQIARYRQPILVERFIRGREVTVGVIGNLLRPVAWRVPEDEQTARVIEGLNFLPTLEVDFAAYPESEAGVYTNRMKTEWAHDFHRFCPAPLDAALLERLQWLTAAVFRVTGCVDVARVDFRLDADDGHKPYILEVNPLPGLYPGLSDLVLEAGAMGMSYDELINAIFDAARIRHGLA
jgi:D-alanine-D-alanine ligase